MEFEIAEPTDIRVTEIKLNYRQPAISIDELAIMLEIDSILGRKTDLRRRLQHALNDACLQGKTQPSIDQTSLFEGHSSR